MGTPKTKFSTIALETVANGGITLIREPPTQFCHRQKTVMKPKRAVAS